MKLQQLRYLVGVADAGLNVTAAAQALHTSQPGISKQLRLLEEELGLRLFIRQSRALVRTTPAGDKVIARARVILREVANIRGLAAEMRRDEDGALSIATTHTQARYVLPPILTRFRQRFPGVRVHLHQGTSEQIVDLVARERVDFVVATGANPLFEELVRIPVYRWRRAIVVPADHPLARTPKPSFAQLGQHPIITYAFSFSGPSSLLEMFAKAGVTPNVALTAWDSDVIKEYVRAGFGVGILADIAIKDEDSDLRVIDASHLFPPHTTWVGFQRGALLRSYMYEFMQLLGAHLPKRQIQAIEQAGTQDAVDKAMAGVDIPFLRP